MNKTSEYCEFYILLALWCMLLDNDVLIRYWLGPCIIKKETWPILFISPPFSTERCIVLVMNYFIFYFPSWWSDEVWSRGHVISFSGHHAGSGPAESDPNSPHHAAALPEPGSAPWIQLHQSALLHGHAWSAQHIPVRPCHVPGERCFKDEIWPLSYTPVLA